MATRKRKPLVEKKPEPRKLCLGKCGKNGAGKPKPLKTFYKVDSPLFPDGRINVCSTCIKEEVDVENLDSVIGFLRQIDKPFIQKIWDSSVESGNYPLGEYIRKINSLGHLKGKTFDNSDNISGVGKIDIQTMQTADFIENNKGEIINYSDELVDKWGVGYKKHEYLKMEKFYQDMKNSHEINTPVHINKLMELAYLTIEQERLRKERDIPNYTKLATAIDKMEQSAGFRPVDRQGLDDATGIRSFSQVFEEVEKRGFRKPPVNEYDEDIIDAMIVSMLNYYHRLVGKQILSELPEEIRDELDSFYDFDDTPVEINDEDYEDLDFSLDAEDYIEDIEEDEDIEDIKKELDEIEEDDLDAKD